MTPEEQRLWREADRVFDRLLDLPHGDREIAVAALDDALRPLVQRLLRGHDSGALDAAPDPGRAIVPRVVGGWTLDEEIGRGGMAVVYRARRRMQGAEQRAAVKIMTVGALAADGRRRFDQEHAVLARMGHPRITPLVDAGVLEDGTPWLAMPLVEGVRMDEWCRDRKLTPQGIVRLFLQVCDAVAHAHRHLVVHRDLKPGNLLVDGEGNVHLLDFGIARLLDDAGEATGTRWRALTPEYAAPEQFQGEDSGVAIDVFGLGAVLYLLLTGRPPRLLADGHDTRITRPSRAAADGERLPADLRLIFSRSLRGDLDLILLKALAHDPDDRYADVAALGEDLRAWLDRRPVRAARADRLYRARKFIARHRGGVAASLLIVAAVLAGLVGTVWQAQLAREAAAVAEREAERATAVKAFLLSLFQASDPLRQGGALHDTRDVLRLGAERLHQATDMPPDLRVELFAIVSDVLRTLGEREDAGAALDAALVMVDGERDVAPVGRAAVMFQKGQLLADLSELDEARDWYDRACSALTDSPSEAARHLRTRILVQRGALAARQGRSEEAQADFEAADRLLAALESEDIELAMVLSSARGVLAFNLGRYQDASHHLRETLALQRRLGNEGQASMVRTLGNLAAVAGMLGQVEQALEYDREALAIARRTYPPGHPMIAESLYTLGDSLRLSGRLDEAMEALAEARTLQHAAEREANVENTDFVRMRVFLARGDYAAAAALSAPVRTAMARRWGPDSREAIHALELEIAARHLGDDAGNLEALLAHAESVLADAAVERRWHPVAQLLRWRMADVALRRGQPDRAERWLREALERPPEATSQTAVDLRIAALRIRLAWAGNQLPDAAELQALRAALGPATGVHPDALVYAWASLIPAAESGHDASLTTEAFARLEVLRDRPDLSAEQRHEIERLARTSHYRP
jgi:eukaryotic-like serine/threonine-protein kinase